MGKARPSWPEHYVYQNSNYPGSILRFTNAIRSGIVHPTQKPVALYQWLLSRYAKPGQKILDTHMGSASIVLAAMNMGFEIDCIELDPTMFDAAENRCREHFAVLSTQASMFAPEPVKQVQEILL